MNAQTVIAQLGGNKFLAMTGARDFVRGSDDLRFRLPRPSKITHFWVRLEADDTYTVEGGKWNAKRLEVVRIKRAEGVTGETLAPIFEQITGLRVSL
jgi:hypothetical protein